MGAGLHGGPNMRPGDACLPQSTCVRTGLGDFGSV